MDRVQADPGSRRDPPSSSSLRIFPVLRLLSEGALPPGRPNLLSLQLAGLNPPAFQPRHFSFYASDPHPTEVGWGFVFTLTQIKLNNTILSTLSSIQVFQSMRLNS